MGDSGILYTTTIKILPEWKETTSDDPDVLPFKTRAASFSLSVDGSTLPSLHDEEGLLVMAAWLHRPLQFLSRIPGDDDDDDYDSADDKRDDDDDDDDVEENNDPDPDSMSLDTEEKDSDGSSNNTSHKSEADDEDIFEDVKVIRDPLSPRKLLDQIIGEEVRLLPRFLYALVSGFTEYPKTCHEPYEQSKVLASALAADVMLRACFPHQIGETTRLIGRKVEHGTMTELRDTLSRFRVTTSRPGRIS